MMVTKVEDYVKHDDVGENDYKIDFGFIIGII